MAKGKGGKSSASAVSKGRKSHGPKKRMFHKYSKCIRIEMAKLGMLKKDADSEAREQSENAKNPRGKK